MTILSAAPNASKTLSAASQPENRLLALDAMRLIAAVVVLLVHACHMLDHPLPWWTIGPLNQRSAVVLFFVLSGYVLTLSLSRDAPGFRAYMKFGVRRLLRLFPLYWAALAFTALVLIWVAGTGGFASSLGDLAVSWPHLTPPQTKQWLAQLTLVVPSMDPSFVLPPVWTLMSEARIAIVFPFLAWIVLRGPLWRGILIVALLSVFSEVLAQHSVRTAGLLGLFGVGAVTARLPRQPLATLGRATWCLLFAVGMILFCLTSLRVPWESPLPLYYVCGIGSSLLILCGIHWAPFAGPMSRLQQFLRVDLSYGIYIFHFPVLLVARRLVEMRVIDLPVSVMFVLCVLVTSVLALIGALFIEKPAIALGRRLTAHQWFQNKADLPR